MKNIKKVIPAATVAAVILLIWQVSCTYLNISSYVLPSPAKVWKVFLKMMASGEMFTDVYISVVRVLKGFTIAFIFAFFLASVKYFVKNVSLFLEPVIQFMRNIAPISMIPLLILWCGIGETTKIVIIILVSFFPIYLNLVKGFTGCDRKLKEVGEAFGYSDSKIFLRIVIPYAVPDILVGMRVSLGYSWRAIIGAEMVAASSGLGHMILFSQQMSRTDKVIVGIIVIGIVGYIFDFLFGLILKHVFSTKASGGWE